MEWLDPFNSFNSWKGLTYINQYNAIEEWKIGKKNRPMVPIEVSLDPIHACNLLCQHCVHPEEKIILAIDKSKKAKDVKKGDILLAFNENANNLEKTVVQKIFKHKNGEYFKISLMNGYSIRATGEHPIYTKRGYIKIKDLNKEDEVLVTSFNDKLSFSRKYKNPMKNKDVVNKHIKINRTQRFRFPDFIVKDCSEQIKKVIELGIIDGGAKWKKTPEILNNMVLDYKSNGIDCLFITDKELYLNTNDTYKKVISFIKDIPNCPHFVKVKNIQFYKEETEVINFECYPFNNYFVNYILTHNCNAHRYLKELNNVRYRMPDKHFLNLIKFLAKWGVSAICFTGDTKVKLVNGTYKTFTELVKEWNKNKQPFEVYSRDEKGNIVPGIAVNPRKTKEITELIEITLDNKEIIKCTPDHKFMLRDGSYKEARDLTDKDSLMSLYTRIHSKWKTAQKILGFNHKIISKKIFKLNKPIPVYCLTVEKYHNFALSAGVFVQNCFGGGGEPTLHTKLIDALLLTKSLGVDSSIATNGTLFNDNLIKTMSENCRWVGVSIDAATSKTYKIGRNVDLFTRAITNLAKFSNYVKKTNSKCDVSYKFLIFGYNQNEIYKACKLAASIGVKDFHARPADFRHQGLGEWKNKQNLYNIKLIEKEFEKCRKLETKDFRVFCVTHKFNDDFTPRRKFTQCYASPICIQLCADGNVYLCPDTRFVGLFKLGKHYPNPQKILKMWGSKRHYDLVFREGCKKCSSRCTFSPYNEQCERLAINKDDPMCINFV